MLKNCSTQRIWQDFNSPTNILCKKHNQATANGSYQRKITQINLKKIKREIFKKIISMFIVYVSWYFKFNRRSFDQGNK